MAALDDQPRKARILPDVVYDEPRLRQCAIDGRNESVDGIRRESEEVEVARLSPNVTARNQRGAARGRETLRLGKAVDDPCDLLLQRSERYLARRRSSIQDVQASRTGGGSTNSSQSSRRRSPSM